MRTQKKEEKKKRQKQKPIQMDGFEINLISYVDG